MADFYFLETLKVSWVALLFTTSSPLPSSENKKEKNSLRLMILKPNLLLMFSADWVN